jgi:hypothetical protein
LKIVDGDRSLKGEESAKRSCHFKYFIKLIQKCNESISLNASHESLQMPLLLEFVRPYKPIQHTMKLTGDYWNAITSNNIVATCNHGVAMIKWSPSKPSFVKLNTDGAYKDKQIADCGGVIRGNEGEWLGGFAKCVGLCSAFLAEL